jgi:hypothetical protein
MHPSKRRDFYPPWLRNMCCLIAVGAIPLLCVAAICGAPVNWSLGPSIASVGIYVIKRVTGAPQA